MSLPLYVNLKYNIIGFLKKKRFIHTTTIIINIHVALSHNATWIFQMFRSVACLDLKKIHGLFNSAVGTANCIVSIGRAIMKNVIEIMRKEVAVA